MTKHVKEVLYSVLLGGSFLAAIPFSINGMLHSQDEDSALFSHAVAIFQRNEEPSDRFHEEQEFFAEDMTVKLETEELVSVDTESLAAEPEEVTEMKEEELSAASDEKRVMFTEVGLDYFDDAFFIGDSRTLGIMEYGGLDNAVFYATSGMNVFKLHDTECKVPGMGKVTYEDALHAKTYKKVYIMLGMNEMGYEYDYILSKYQAIIDEIIEVHPDTVIYVCANLHLTKDAQGEILNNPDLDVLNERISELADGERIFYLNINPYYDDGEGNLNPEYSTDGVHIYAKYYAEWVNWFRKNAIEEIPLKQ